MTGEQNFAVWVNRCGFNASNKVYAVAEYVPAKTRPVANLINLVCKGGNICFVLLDADIKSVNSIVVCCNLDVLQPWLVLRVEMSPAFF